MKKIAFVTTQRSEYNASRYVIKAIDDDPELDLYLIAGCSHWYLIEEDGFNVYPIGSYDAISTKKACHSLSDVLKETSEMLMNIKPDMLIINGDRIEMMPIVLAATIHGVPIAHIGGGDITEGSVDNLTRYAISRYAHLHLVSDAQAAKNLIQSGEEPWRVHDVGQCGLENMAMTEKLSLEETSKAIGLDLSIPTALCIYYPDYALTIGRDVKKQINCILRGLHETGVQVIFIRPCAEIGADIINTAINEYWRTHDNCNVFSNLDNQLFQSVLWHSAFMIGNSSAGVLEAPFINKWSIHVGYRQRGRIKHPRGYYLSNRRWDFCPEDGVIDCEYSWQVIKNNIIFCLNNPKTAYNASDIDLPSQKIIKIIKENIDNPNLLYKKILLSN